MPSLEFDRVGKRFGGLEVVEDFTLDVEDGELIVLVGASGSGKSTVLRMLAGLETVTAGRIRLGGRDITDLPPRRRDVAMVFQDYALYPHMTVRENLSLGLRLRKVPRQEIDRRVSWAAGLLGLEALLERKPRQLSGGQRQRVAMGRAMVREPLVFLFDEPLSNLDAGLRAQMRIEIGALQRRLGTTTVYVTHDQVEAMTLGDRIVVLADGRIQQVGRPIEIYRDPANRFVAGFIGSPPMNFVEGSIVGGDDGPAFVADGLRVQLAADRFPAVLESGPATLGIRPEDVRIGGDGSRAAEPAGGSPAGEATAGSPGEERTGGVAAAERTGAAADARILLVERLGAASHVHVEVGRHRLVAAVASDAVAEPGATVGVRLATAGVHLFDREGRALRAGR